MKTSLRWNSVVRILGRLVLVESLLLLLPMGVCLCYGESDWLGFAIAAAAAAAVGGAAEWATRNSPASIRGREGFARREAASPLAHDFACKV